MLDALPSYPVQAIYLGMPLLMALVVWFSFRTTLWFKFNGIDTNFFRSSNISLQARARANLAHYIANHLLLPLASRTKIFCHLEPEHCLNEILNRSHIHLDDQFDEVLNQEVPLLWGNLPPLLKNRVYATAHNQLPRLVDDLLEDIIDEIETIWDLEETIFNKLQRQPELKNRFFNEALKKDLNRAGLLATFTGLCCGFLQAVLSYQFQTYWVFIGSGTAFAILAVIWHLRFVSSIYLTDTAINTSMNNSQEQGSDAYGDLIQRIYPFITEHFFTPTETFKQIFTGVHQLRTQQLMRKHSKGITDGSILKPITQIGGNFETYAKIKNQINNKLTQMLLLSVEDHQFNRNRSRTLQKLFIDRAQRLNYSEQSHLIQTPLQNVKIELIILTGVLGAGIGTLEYLLFL